MSEKF